MPSSSKGSFAETGFHKRTQRKNQSAHKKSGAPNGSFLKEIFTSNFRDMGNLGPSVFGLIKMSVSVTKKRSAKIFGKEIRPKVFGKWTKMP